jgi:hypothetical protein
MIQIVRQTQHLKQSLSLRVAQIAARHVAPAAARGWVVCWRCCCKVVWDAAAALLLQELLYEGHVF